MVFNRVDHHHQSIIAITKSFTSWSTPYPDHKFTEIHWFTVNHAKVCPGQDFMLPNLFEKTGGVGVFGSSDKWTMFTLILWSTFQTGKKTCFTPILTTSYPILMLMRWILRADFAAASELCFTFQTDTGSAFSFTLAANMSSIIHNTNTNNQIQMHKYTNTNSWEAQMLATLLYFPNTKY